MGWSRGSTSAAHLGFSQARINDPVSWGAPQNHHSKVGLGLCSPSSGGFEGALCWGPALPGGVSGTDRHQPWNKLLLGWWHQPSQAPGMVAWLGHGPSLVAHTELGGDHRWECWS